MFGEGAQGAGARGQVQRARVRGGELLALAGQEALEAGAVLTVPDDVDVHVEGGMLGILGLGRIGRAIALRGTGFAMEVRYHGRKARPDVLRQRKAVS